MKFFGIPIWAWLVLVGIIAIWWWGLEVSHWVTGASLQEGVGELNEVGDSFGTINTLFSGIALWGVIVTLILQGRELRLSTKELKNSSSSLADQVKVASTTAMLSSLFELKKLFSETLIGERLATPDDLLTKQSIIGALVRLKRECYNESDILSSKKKEVEERLNLLKGKGINLEGILGEKPYSQWTAEEKEAERLDHELWDINSKLDHLQERYSLGEELLRKMWGLTEEAYALYNQLKSGRDEIWQKELDEFLEGR